MEIKFLSNSIANNTGKTKKMDTIYATIDTNNCFFINITGDRIVIIKPSKNKVEEIILFNFSNFILSLSKFGVIKQKIKQKNFEGKKFLISNETFIKNIPTPTENRNKKNFLTAL